MHAGEQNKISLIIPVYNVEKYLRKCLDTAVSQTYRNYEIILVDDGSTDNSYQICTEYSRMYEHILLIIQKENAGLASAWQCGLEASNGEYVAFLDSDDWIEPDYIERLSYGIKMGADVVCCNKLLEYGTYSVIQMEHTSPGYYNRAELLKNLFPKMLNDGTYLGRRITPHRCGKLFKKELLKDNIKYCDKTISFGEDLNIVLPALMDCNAVLILQDEKGLYHYRQNRASIIRTYKTNMYEQISRLHSCLIKADAEKKEFSFKTQLDADFFCLFLEYVKNETKNKDKRSITIKNVLDNYQKMQADTGCDFAKKLNLKFSDRILCFLLRKSIYPGIYLWVVFYSSAKAVSGEVDWKYLFTKKIKKKKILES